jgi:hypothetical protein
MTSLALSLCEVSVCRTIGMGEVICATPTSLQACLAPRSAGDDMVGRQQPVTGSTVEMRYSVHVSVHMSNSKGTGTPFTKLRNVGFSSPGYY